tara:strand:- start:4733 stop:5335 length:603 start_codon:yes stop_codon:yes gene_type:complete
MANNIHKFYILTREPSPFGNASSVSTVRRRISRGETKSGTSKLRKYDPVSDSINEEEVKIDKVKLNPGELSEEFLDGATVRWTVTINGREHTVVDKITMKELKLLTTAGFTAGINAYNTISSNVSYRTNIEDFDAAVNPISATFTYAEFITMIQKGRNTQLDFLTEVLFKRNIGLEWTEDSLRNVIAEKVSTNLPLHVTL